MFHYSVNVSQIDTLYFKSLPRNSASSILTPAHGISKGAEVSAISVANLGPLDTKLVKRQIIGYISFLNSSTSISCFSLQSVSEEKKDIDNLPPNLPFQLNYKADY